MVNIEEEFADELLEFVEKCTDFLHEHKDKLSIAVLNINSISRKFHNIEFLLSKHQIKVLVINESKIHDENNLLQTPQLLLNLDYKLLNYKLLCRNRTPGGIIVYVNKSIQIKEFEISEDLEL